MRTTDCCDHGPRDEAGRRGPAYRRALWIALVINASMFLVEVVVGAAAGSAALQADALDFMADAANYGISLLVVGMALHVRARAALVKGVSMGLLGLVVLGSTVWHAVQGTLPSAAAMGAVGFAALAANVLVVGVLWAYRAGDSNMRSVWLCSRNDALGNAAVILAALGVFGTSTGWPDLAVAAIMAALALQAAWATVRQAVGELRRARVRQPAGAGRA